MLPNARFLRPASGVLLALLLALPARSAAQAPAPRPAYDPHAAFDPGLFSEPATATRAASGAPGPGYWQNRADYSIHVRLDPDAHTVSGGERITYTNESPDTLRYLWLQLDQNYYRAGARSRAVSPPGQPPAEVTDGFEIASVRIGGAEARREVHGTRMKVLLDPPLAPRGGTVELAIDYGFTVPAENPTRLGRMETENGPIYEIAQWYPRMAVYDDLRGWNTLPYLGSGEFYLDYGDFDYTVEVPRGWMVMGSGALENPAEVLTASQRERLEAARASAAPVTIVGPDEIGDPSARPAGEGPLAWRFRMEETRDVSWAASPAFVWDAARIDLPSGRRALAMSAYPVESAGEAAWGRSTEFVKASVEIFSERWFEYPWPVAVNVAGPEGGMEYPGIVFCHWTAAGEDLWGVTTHEIGHEWFPMIVGSDERRHAWMDEGFDSFIDVDSTDRFHGGEFAPKRDAHYAPGGGNPAEEIVGLLLDPDAPPMESLADAISETYRHPVSYYKPALGLTLLRDVVLGPERFDAAFREYVRRWAYRHPRPEDFFRTVDDVAGEDLGWFWKGWFLRNWAVDLAVAGVEYVDGDPARGARITLEARARLPMPTTVRIVEEGGRTSTVELPVEVWQEGPAWTFGVDSTAPLASVTVDPERRLPDVDRSNDRWTGP